MGRPFGQIGARAALVLIAVFVAMPQLAGQNLDESLLKGIQWRQIGPFRAVQRIDSEAKYTCDFSACRIRGLSDW
jgi:hypothetical protein